MVESGGTFWLFYSANLWGTPNYGIGIARCASVAGPCSKPLSHTRGSQRPHPGNPLRGPGERSSSRSAVSSGWCTMRWHRGSPATWRSAGCMSTWSRFPQGDCLGSLRAAPAAALAEAALYENADLPSQPQQAYLTLLHQVGRHWPEVNDVAAVADAEIVATTWLSARMLGRWRHPWKSIL